MDMGRSGWAIRPQDILILLKLIALKNKAWRQLDLAQSLDLSQAEIAFALQRLREAGLVDGSKRKAQRLAAIEFLIYALKYLLPPKLGAFSRGIRTASSAKPIAGKVINSEAPMVWPHEEGDFRGLALEPIYESVPQAAKRDSELYELLVIVDSLRVGGVRERKFAETEIRRRLLKA